MNNNTKLYKFIDGKVFSASSSEDLVEQIRLSSWMPGKSVDDFMEMFSYRANNLLGIKISYNNINYFVDDLVKYNILSMILPQ